MKLEPCPFCGRDDFLSIIEEEIADYNEKVVVCDMCGAKAFLDDNLGWNNRPGEEETKKAARVEAEQALADELNNPGGDYYTGLRCGVEDRQISDRYEAAEYGWDQAFSYIESVLEAEK